MSMLWKCLPDLKLDGNDILVFDRLYASHLLILYLQHLGVQFCFRMKKDWWKPVEQFYNSGQKSKIITLFLPEREISASEELGITDNQLKCRLVRVELEGGETEILLTSLLDERKYSVADMKELYGLRWSVEEYYKAFKYKVCIANFSGKSVKAILQDFYVKIFIMNLTAVAVRPISEALKRKSVKVKYRHQVNFTEAIATMKKAVVSFFLTHQVDKALKRLYERLLKTTEPIRPGRKFERHHQPRRKWHMNYKPI
jgi:hypothetical protein